MVNEGIVLRHKISERGIEVDKAKVHAIEKMPCIIILKYKKNSTKCSKACSYVATGE